MKDDELEKLLAPLRAQAPTDIELRKWELAMARESRAAATPGAGAYGGTHPLGSRFIRRLEWLRLATALGIGIGIGALLFKTPASNSVAIEMASATFEHSHANLD